MFRPSERLSPSGRTDSRRYLKRAGLFAAGLVLLWIALQLFPSSNSQPPVYSDDAGSVATSEQIRPTYQGPRLFTFGNLAALLVLVGGGGFAYYLHKRNRTGARGASSPIESLGELAIGQGQQLRLIRCGGEVMLVGATTQGITLLREFDTEAFEEEEEEEYGQLHAADDSHALPGRGAKNVKSSTPQHVNNSAFADVLRSYAGRYVNIQSNGRAC